MLRKLKAALLGGALMLGSLSGVQASETTPWGQVGWWQIRVDHSVSNGCFAAQSFDKGAIARIGFDLSHRQIYILLGREGVTGIAEGAHYSVNLVFDDGVRYYNNVTLTVHNMDGLSFLVHANIGAEFYADFARLNNLKVINTVDGQQIFSLSLANTYAALMEVIRCQEIQNGAHPPQVTQPSKPDQSVSNDGPWQIPVQRRGGGITLSVRLNDGERLEFMLDTGASTIGIPQDLADRLGLKTIRKARMQYADGRTAEESVVMLDKVALNGVLLRNVEATVGPTGSALLLGKNFLDRFSSYSIDNRQSLLILNK